jgi:hypothetical protein
MRIMMHCLSKQKRRKQYFLNARQWRHTTNWNGGLITLSARAPEQHRPIVTHFNSDKYFYSHGLAGLDTGIYKWKPRYTMPSGPFRMIGDQVLVIGSIATPSLGFRV